MSAYTLLISLHVVVAILGIGQVGAIAVATSTARRNELPLGALATWIRPLLFGVRTSLPIMFVTGAILDATAGGAHHDWWWFRLSALLLVVTFVINTRARAALSKGLQNDGAAAPAISRIERAGWSMCGTVALITVLMQAKPF
jgi:uncharacterized membrane protein